MTLTYLPQMCYHDMFAIQFELQLPRPTVQVHTASQVLKGGRGEAGRFLSVQPILVPSVPPLEATMTNPLPILAILKPIPSHLPCPYPCLPCPYPYLPLSLPTLPKSLPGPQALHKQVWLGISEGRVIKEFSEDFQQ